MQTAYYTVEQIRVVRLYQLEAEFIATCTAAGQAATLAGLAEFIGTDPNYLRQVATAWRDKTIGSTFARHVEARFGKPRGWLDTLADAPAPIGGQVARCLIKLPADRRARALAALGVLGGEAEPAPVKRVRRRAPRRAA